MELNSLLPYDITEEADLTYSFTTRHGITYHAYFLDYSCYHPAFANVYTFNIEPEEDTPHPIDQRIALTVILILKLFFSRNENAMIMICDNLDGKERKREMLFTRWFMRYNDGSIQKYDASSTTDDYMLYVSLYIHRDNPDARQLVAAFYDLVKNNLYPLE